MPKQKVGIVIPKRPQFGDAYWAIQRRFDSGFHVVEVDERELAELQADPVATLVEGAALDAAIEAQTAPTVEAEPEAAKPGKPMKRG